MGFKERFLDMAVTLTLRGFMGSIHTQDGKIGSVSRTDIIGGKIEVRLNDGSVKTYPGREVADIDTPL